MGRLGLTSLQREAVEPLVTTGQTEPRLEIRRESARSDPWSTGQTEPSIRTEPRIGSEPNHGRLLAKPNRDRGFQPCRAAHKLSLLHLDQQPLAAWTTAGPRLGGCGIEYMDNSAVQQSRCCCDALCTIPLHHTAAKTAAMHR
jgi:hypothetical protein